MATSHFEKIRFLTLEQVQEVFDLSLDSLGDFTDTNGMLSPDIVKAIVETQLWFRLQKLFDAEDPTMGMPETLPPWAAHQPRSPGNALSQRFDESNVRRQAHRVACHQ